MTSSAEQPSAKADPSGAFVEAAVGLGYMTPEQGAEFRSLLDQTGLAGLHAHIAVKKGYLTPDQVRAVQAELVRKGVRPVIGGCEIIAKLGEGGMGTVYKARQTSLDRVVAVKVLAPVLARDAKYVGRFEREARLAASLTHPNTVHVHDVGVDEGRHYIVMEFVDGQSLDKLLESGPLEERRALEIVRDVAGALAEAHEQGIVHRDIKPANILLRADGAPKLADLGLAKNVADAAAGGLTQSGVYVGTPRYMSPEQCRGAPDLDARSDIYSLGITLYEMLTGRPPFEGPPSLLIFKHGHQPLPDPRAERPGLSENAVSLLKDMTAKERDKRVPTCREVRRRIETILGVAELKPSSPAKEEAAVALSVPPRGRRCRLRPLRPRQRTTRPRRPFPFVPAAVAAILLLAFGALALIVHRVREHSLAAEAERRTAAERREAERRAVEEAARQAEAARAEAERKAQEEAARAEGARKAEEEWARAETAWPFDADEAKRRQRESAQQLGIPLEANLDLGGGVTMKLVYIPPGEFMMGSPDNEEGRSTSEGPQHRVRITKGFYMGVTEVTQAQYEAVMGNNPSRFKGRDNPVETVSWNDAAQFCERASRKTGRTVRLPTEAEWEYACRAGSSTRFCFGDADGGLGEYAWYPSNSGGATKPVGQKKPNAWGLYDVHGNVWEWCADWYAADYYGKSPSTDPTGPVTGQSRVLRGGSWSGSPRVSRAACRDRNFPGNRYTVVGFRVVCVFR